MFFKWGKKTFVMHTRDKATEFEHIEIIYDAIVLSLHTNTFNKEFSSAINKKNSNEFCYNDGTKYILIRCI